MGLETRDRGRARFPQRVDNASVDVSCVTRDSAAVDRRVGGGRTASKRTLTSTVRGSSCQTRMADMSQADEVRRLVQRAREGDREAIGDLYELYALALFNVGLRLLGSSADAEDVVHDVFAGLAKALRSYAGRGSFEGWLRQIATRVALMRLRRRKILPEVSLHESVTVSSEPPSTVLDQITLRDALQRLPDDQRVVVVLKDIEGYSHTEIAEMEGITANASRARLFRAHETLREFLKTAG